MIDPDMVICGAQHNFTHDREDTYHESFKETGSEAKEREKRGSPEHFGRSEDGELIPSGFDKSHRLVCADPTLVATLKVGDLGWRNIFDMSVMVLVFVDSVRNWLDRHDFKCLMMSTLGVLKKMSSF